MAEQRILFNSKKDAKCVRACACVRCGVSRMCSFAYKMKFQYFRYGCNDLNEIKETKHPSIIEIKSVEVEVEEFQFESQNVVISMPHMHKTCVFVCETLPCIQSKKEKKKTLSTHCVNTVRLLTEDSQIIYFIYCRNSSLDVWMRCKRIDQ